jgi:7-cyano-7-deazaguanine synthase
MLITLAGMRFVNEGLKEIMIGAVRTDVHADGKSPFFRAIGKLMAVQEGSVAVSAPARSLHPLRLLQASGFPDTLLGLTFSCHVMQYPCGRCRGCMKHLDTLTRVKRSTRRMARENGR